jgi:hypothetical protein
MQPEVGLCYNFTDNSNELLGKIQQPVDLLSTISACPFRSSRQKWQVRCLRRLLLLFFGKLFFRTFSKSQAFSQDRLEGVPVPGGKCG